MYIKHILTGVVMLMAVAASAQTEKTTTQGEASSSKVYSYVEQMPEAGYDYNDYLFKHIIYPANARKNDIEGRAVIKFIVNEDGAISDCQVIRSSGNADLDNEALRVVRTFPKWKPARQNGKLVKVYYNLPIVFRLEKNDVKKSK